MNNSSENEAFISIHCDLGTPFGLILPKPPFHMMSLQMVCLKLLPHLQGAKESLSHYASLIVYCYSLPTASLRASRVESLLESGTCFDINIVFVWRHRVVDCRRMKVIRYRFFNMSKRIVPRFSLHNYRCRWLPNLFVVAVMIVAPKFFWEAFKQEAHSFAFCVIMKAVLFATIPDGIISMWVRHNIKHIIFSGTITLFQWYTWLW